MRFIDFHRILYTVDAIQEELNLNEANTNEQGEQVVPFDGDIHSEEVIKELRDTIKLTKQCYVMLKHARKLLEGNYGDGMYILRLKEDLDKLELDGLKKTTSSLIISDRGLAASVFFFAYLAI